METDCRHIETNLVHGSGNYDEKTGAITVPIYQSATFKHEGLNKSTGYDYSRTQNPTREALEKTIALLEGGKQGFAFSTGMAAIAAIGDLFLPGEHVILSEDLYGGTYRYFEGLKKYGIETSYIDTTKEEALVEGLQENTKAIFIETPSNPMMKITDIKRVSEIAKQRNILTIVDNTFLTPYFQKPLELGADIVIHSGTKYLGGHNDTLAGLIVVKEDGLIEKFKINQKSVGAVLAPFDSWLILRGMKTLGIRLEKQQQNAMILAKFLSENEKVEEVFYPGLPSHPGFDILQKQSKGFGGMISFTLKNLKAVERVLEEVKIITFAESLGGVESLITYPYVQTHEAIPEKMRESVGVTDKLLRLSVGIENVQDLIEDLDSAIGKEEF